MAGAGSQRRMESPVFESGLEEEAYLDHYYYCCCILVLRRQRLCCCYFYSPVPLPPTAATTIPAPAADDDAITATDITGFTTPFTITTTNITGVSRASTRPREMSFEKRVAVILARPSPELSSEGYVVVALQLSRGSTINDANKYVARGEAQGMI